MGNCEKVIGLGGNGSVCSANVGFRSVPAGDALGPPESVVLRQGDSQTVTFSLFSLRLAVGEHADVQPVLDRVVVQLARERRRCAGGHQSERDQRRDHESPGRSLHGAIEAPGRWKAVGEALER